MFRLRKKSSPSSPSEVERKPAISISGPMRIAPPHASTRTNVSSTAGLGHWRRSSKTKVEGSADVDAAMPIEEERAGQGIPSLMTQQQQQQQQSQPMSPPTSPTFPRARTRTTSNANADVNNVNVNVNVKERPMPRVVDDPRKLTPRMLLLTPPSPSRVTQSASSSPTVPLSPMTKQSTTTTTRNDPEVPSRSPRRAKYSPLAAFGPPVPTKDVPPPRPRTSTSHTEPFAYSERHEPSVLNSVDLENFHSPLFGAGKVTRRNDVRDDDDDDEPRVVQHGSQLQVEANMIARSFDGDDVGHLERWDHVGVRGKSQTNGRMGTGTPPSSTWTKSTTPPTPSSPIATTMLHNSAALTSNGENERDRKRSDSTSSAGSVRRKVGIYAKFTDVALPGIPQRDQEEREQEDRSQTPRTPVMRGRIPTPPTSVDEHDHGNGNEVNPRMTDHEYSPVTTSPSPFDREMRDVTADPGSGASVSARSTPKFQTQDLPALSQQTSLSSFPVHLNGARGHIQQQVPLSPPQSPPQQITPVLSTQSQSQSQSRSLRIRTRSKSRTRSSNRPDTGSSAQSQSLNYVPPSSASSSDGPGRSSPSAFSVLNSFTAGSSGNGHSRKLVKTPPHSTRSTMTMENTAEQYRRTITESPVDTQMHGAGSLVDEDPFAKGEIVRALPPLPQGSSSLAGGETDAASVGPMTPPVPPFARARSASGSGSGFASGSVPPSPASSVDYFSSRPQKREDSASRQVVPDLFDLRSGMDGEQTPRPLTAESGADANKTVEEGTGAEPEFEPEPEPEPEAEAETEEPTYYPLGKHLMVPELLSGLLPYLSFRDWIALTAVNDAMRRRIEHTRELRELVLEHYLRTVGYSRWRWSTKEHVMLTFRDLNSYMRGVSIPSHQYATQTQAYLDAKQQSQEQSGDEYLKFTLKTATVQKSLLASSCRAYTRVVLRLRAQAEALERGAEGDETVYQFTPPQSTTSVNANAKQPGSQNPARRSMSRVRAGTPSRPDSPSSMSQSQHGHFMNGSNSSSSHGHGYANGYGKVNRYERAGMIAGLGPRFRSPLFRLGHAPCLRVCVPNPEGIWLSDASVLECEKELKRAGVLPLMRVGDVVWDTAVGDEGNVGRMVWDGNYLIDLDYTYSRTGEVPQYLHTLSFPPSYFHRVIRTTGNPICHIDVSPWGEEIAANLQLLQDRIKTETPQGGHHTVVRWIHRSKFRIRPNPYTYYNNTNNAAPIAIPGTSLSVDPGWYGTIIIEIEGTNEGLADLQQRCRSGFPPRARGAVAAAVVVGGGGAGAGGGENGHGHGHGHMAGGKPASKVWRLLRERSRPGEIWLRAVREKERLL